MIELLAWTIALLLTRPIEYYLQFVNSKRWERESRGLL